MNDFAAAFRTAFTLIGSFDSELRDIVLLSLEVSLTASACAFAIGAPLGTALAVYRFKGRGALVVIANALLGLPPVVVGLAVYLLLSRSGPLGSFGILFTPTAMVIAQCALGTPIVIALAHRVAVGDWRAYGDALLIDGASRLRTIAPLMNIGREGLLTAFLAAFGRAIAEVGAIIIVGGNIRGYTRTMTTAIALETSNQGRLELCARARNYSHRVVDDGQQHQPFCRARPRPLVSGLIIVVIALRRRSQRLLSLPNKLGCRGQSRRAAPKAPLTP
jgi:tungstate transport system permease protein